KSALDTIGASQIDIKPGETPRSALLRHKSGMMAQIGPANPTTLEFDTVADKLRGSQAEAQLIDPTWLWDLGGLPPSTELTDGIMDVVSPLRGADNFNYGQFKNLMDLRYHARGICFTDPEVANIGNHDIQGVAEYFARKYSDDKLTELFPEQAARGSSYFTRKRAELIYTDLWKDTYKGIQLHEMGHALGMLHQFASSYDSTNYNPQYWQLRTQEGRAMASCQETPRE